MNAVAISGRQWPSVAVSGGQWIPVAASGYRWLSVSEVAAALREAVLNLREAEEEMEITINQQN